MRALIACALALTCMTSSLAGPTGFHDGKIIPGYGEVATVVSAPAIAPSTRFKVAFDVAEGAESGKPNRHLESAARFLNMHAESGVPAENMRIAIVVHGAAAMDLVNDEKFGGSNSNAGLIAALIKAGVSIKLCGQTAAYRDIAADDLLPGVGMALSAMTEHALLQQDGFSLNPF